MPLSVCSELTYGDAVHTGPPQTRTDGKEALRSQGYRDTVFMSPDQTSRGDGTRRHSRERQRCVSCPGQTQVYINGLTVSVRKMPRA